MDQRQVGGKVRLLQVKEIRHYLVGNKFESGWFGRVQHKVTEWANTKRGGNGAGGGGQGQWMPKTCSCFATSSGPSKRSAVERLNCTHEQCSRVGRSEQSTLPGISKNVRTHTSTAQVAPVTSIQRNEKSTLELRDKH